MGVLGKLISTPIRIINAPARALEDLLGCDSEDDRVASKPLDLLADEIEEVDED